MAANDPISWKSIWNWPCPDQNQTRFLSGGERWRKADAIMQKVASMRIPCPLLDENNECYLLWNKANELFGLYGIPTEIDGKSRVCGLSNFDKGSSYPTVKLGKLQKMLEELSSQISFGYRFSTDLEDVYVPLSMRIADTLWRQVFWQGKKRWMNPGSKMWIHPGEKVFKNPEIDIFPDEQPAKLSEKQKILKRQIYEQMKPGKEKICW